MNDPRTPLQSARSARRRPRGSDFAMVAGAALLAAAPPAFARVAGVPVDAGGGRGLAGEHSMCDVPVFVLDAGTLQNYQTPSPLWDFRLNAGLWVGAIADRGAGDEISVSTTFFAHEFTSVSEPAPARGHALPTSRVPSLDLTYVDTIPNDLYPEHRPLGLSVHQESAEVQSSSGLHWIDLKYRIRNVSPELTPGGWPLRMVYVGLMADPDVGTATSDQPWADDWGAFVPARGTGNAEVPGAARGDLAYSVDDPGTGADDVTTQVGIALRGRRAHRFSVWSFEDDPTTDADRYARMRGDSDDAPTIDPPSTRAADQRILLAVGPFPMVAPGEEITFAASLVCGELGPLPIPRGPGDAPVSWRLADRVVSPGARELEFSTLPNDDFGVEIWDVAGRKLADVDPGRAWDLRANGRVVPAGVYFYRFRAHGGVHGDRTNGTAASAGMGRIVVVR
ncbi:MAG: hypothetical protein KC591_02270 [Gemmatimonadetes bacterium]|nr:hypothetical protein [Gemmatimonadota bacterium]